MNSQRPIYRFLIVASLMLSGLMRAVPVSSAHVDAPEGESDPPAQVQLPAQAILFQDDFEDGDFTNADGAGGLAWSVIAGNASVDSVDSSLQLGVYRGYTLMATTQNIAGDEYTLRCAGRITWSTPGRIVVLYKDEEQLLLDWPG